MALKNAIHVIKPYRWYNMWVFDDPRIDLEKEPFVSSMAEIINTVLEQKGLAVDTFTMLFSKTPFPDADIKLEWDREYEGGNWYKWGDKEGWLCPALGLYYDEPPKELYIQING